MDRSGRWVVVALVVLTIVLGVLRARFGAPPEDVRPFPPGPILLISLDNVRADRLGCYGHDPYALPVTPHLDRLAEECLLYEDATSPSNWTLPAHASLLTGLRPRQHGVINHAFRLDPDGPTLATILQEAGYRTSARVAHSNVSAQHGLSAGFDVWTDEWSLWKGPRPADPPADQLCRAALEDLRRMLAQNPQAPVFYFLHLFTAHWPFEPDPEFAEAFDPLYEGPVDGSGPWVTRFFAELHTDEDRRGLLHLSRLYDAELATLDRALGILLDGLRESGLLGSMTVVVTSDHGEAFKEHEVFSHGFGMFQEEIHVPLLVKLPRRNDMPRPQKRVTRPVSLVDVLPTLVELARAQLPPRLDGLSLLRPPLEGGRRMLISESSLTHLFMDFDRLALRLGPLKYQVAPAVDWFGARYGEFVFNVAEDPGELSNLLPTHAGLEKECRSMLASYGYELEPAWAMVWGPGLPAGTEFRILLDSWPAHVFRARTASLPAAALADADGAVLYPRQADVDSLTVERLDDGATRVTLSGLCLERPAGVIIALKKAGTSLTLETLGLSAGTNLSCMLHRAESPGASETLGPAPRTFSVEELGPLPPWPEPPAGEVWIGTLELPRYRGPIRGQPLDLADLPDNVRENLREMGYILGEPGDQGE